MNPAPIRVLLAAGASGSESSMRPWLAGLARRGFETGYVALPRAAADRAVPVFRQLIGDDPGAVVGGRSFGGRMASMAAAETPSRGLILLSYPLHRPGHPETAPERTAHWPRIECPVLLLSGESDPFARIDLLREAVRLLPVAELVTYPRIGHSLDRIRAEALRRIAGWLSLLNA